MTPPRSTRFAAFLVLFVLPFALRILPLTHGGERNYVPDTHIVRAALGMARDHTLVPPVGVYSNYPNLLPYLLLPIYGIQFAVGLATHSWSSIQSFGEHMLAHPQHAAWSARALIALLGALTTWVVYRGARAAGLQRGAWVAAFLTATCLLDVHLSTHERPWAPMVLFMAAAGWAAIVYATTASTRAIALCGILAGLAFATHQGGLGALALPGLAWWFGPVGWKTWTARKQRLVHGIFAVALFFLIAALLGYPARFVHGATSAASVIGGDKAQALPSVTVFGLPIVLEVRWDNVGRLVKSLLGYDPILIALGLAGLVLAFRDRRLRALAVFTLVWGAFFLTNRSDHVRYLLPAAVFLAWPAGALAERWLTKPLGEPAVAVLLLLPLIQALRFDWIMSEPDTRAVAEAKLAQLPPGACVAIDRYGPEVDLDKAAIYRLETLRRSSQEALRRREQFRKDQIDSGAASGGVNAVHMEDLIEIDERSGGIEIRKGLQSLGSTPRAVLKQLGVTHCLRVQRRSGDAESERLFGPSSAASLVWIIEPGARRNRPDDARSLGEALLPTEMDFPLTGLWSIERPGPRLELTTFD